MNNDPPFKDALLYEKLESVIASEDAPVYIAPPFKATLFLKVELMITDCEVKLSVTRNIAPPL